MKTTKMSKSIIIGSKIELLDEYTREKYGRFATIKKLVRDSGPRSKGEIVFCYVITENGYEFWVEVNSIKPF